MRGFLFGKAEMDNIQKQSIMAILESLEYQVICLKKIISTGNYKKSSDQIHQDSEDGSFTTKEDDRRIAEALEIKDDERQLLLQDIFKDIAKEPKKSKKPKAREARVLDGSGPKQH